MNEFTIGSLVLNLILGIGTYMLKDVYQDLKSRVTKLEDNTVKKDDFKEFKVELFERISELKEDIKHAVQRKEH